MSTKRPFVGIPGIGDKFEIDRHVPLTLESDNPLRDVLYSGNYKTSAYHPAGEGETNDPTNYAENGDIDGIKCAGGDHHGPTFSKRAGEKVDYDYYLHKGSCKGNCPSN